MKKILLTLLFAAVSAFGLKAQNPGLYAVEGDNLVPLQHEHAAVKYRNFLVDEDDVNLDIEIELVNKNFVFRKKESATKVSGKEFLLVCDPDKKAMTIILKKYFAFPCHQTPANMLLVALTPSKRTRIYSTSNAVVDGFDVTFESIPFEWEEVAPYQYRIITDLPAGEYGFIFRFEERTAYKIDHQFTFSVQ